MMDYTEKKLMNIRNEIMNGNIAVNPYRKTDSTGENACGYCPYHSVCHFDRKIAGNEYRILEKLSNDDVMYKIAKEAEQKVQLETK